MKKWIILFLIVIPTSLFAGTISRVSIDSKIVEITITPSEASSLQIDDTIFLKGRNDEFSLKGKIQALKPKGAIVTIEFGIEMLKAHDFVKVYQAKEMAEKQQLSVVSQSPSPGKTSEMSVSLLYWMGGSVSFGDLGVDVDKEPGLVFKFSYDNISSDGNSFGFFLQYAPTVALSYGSLEESGTMTEYGIALKTILNPGSDTEIKPGVNLGYRTVTASGMDDVEGFGVNASLQIVPKNQKSKMYFDVGFLSQPNGGNAETTVTFAPILYLGGGLFL